MCDFKILIVDDERADRVLIRRLLERTDLSADVEEASTSDEALSIDGSEPDAVFLDYRLPGVTGLTCLPDLRHKWPRAAIFMVTGQGDEEIATSAIKGGATDYITKGVINRNALERMVRNGVEAARMRWKIEQQRQDLAAFSEVLIHDLRAPIRAAAYLAEQIEEDLDLGDHDEVRAGLRLMRKSTTRMQQMIRSLSDHVRLDRSDTFEPFSADYLIDGALTLLTLEVSESGAAVEVEVDPALPEISCGGPMVSLVLQNLVANAIKYAGDTSPRIRITAARDGDRARFEVSDNGMGIAPEYRDSIFEPFKRVPGMTEIQGTGLGLATCRKIVQRHGGTIWCDSEPGVGTRMIFTLPLSQEAAVPVARIA